MEAGKRGNSGSIGKKAGRKPRRESEKLKEKTRKRTITETRTHKLQQIRMNIGK